MAATASQLQLRGVSASSTLGASCGVEKVLDGTVMTHWASQRPSGQEWLLFDAGEPVDVSRIDMQHSSSCHPDLQAKDCALLVGPSEDGPWESALVFSTARTFEWQSFQGARGCGRFWKLALNSKHGDSDGQGMFVRGVKLYGIKETQLLTLHATRSEDGTSIDVLVTSMAGDEVAQLHTSASTPLREVLAEVQADLSPKARSFMLGDGRLVQPAEPDQSLGSFLDFGSC